MSGAVVAALLTAAVAVVVIARGHDGGDHTSATTVDQPTPTDHTTSAAPSSTPAAPATTAVTPASSATTTTSSPATSSTITGTSAPPAPVASVTGFDDHVRAARAMVDELMQRADDADGFTQADADWTLSVSGFPDCPEYRSSVLAQVGQRHDWQVRTFTVWQGGPEEGPQQPGDVEFTIKAIDYDSESPLIGGPFRYDDMSDPLWRPGNGKLWGDGYLTVEWRDDGTPKLLDGQCYS